MSLRSFLHVDGGASGVGACQSCSCVSFGVPTRPPSSPSSPLIMAPARRRTKTESSPDASPSVAEKVSFVDGAPAQVALATEKQQQQNGDVAGVGKPSNTAMSTRDKNAIALLVVLYMLQGVPVVIGKVSFA